MRFDFLALAALVGASTLTPNTVPLIVRNPYLSTWLYHARDAPWENWPMFWTGAHVGFSVMASVPSSGKVYPLLGRPHDSLPSSHKSYKVTYPEYLGLTFDASTTNLTYSIPGSSSPLRLTLSFLSPITPSSTFRQSIPAAYMTVIAEGCFDVDVYTDLNGEWVTGNRDNTLRWELHEPAGQKKGNGTGTAVKTWKVARASEQLLTEFADRAEWGTLHFSAPADVKHQSGTSAILRQHFAEKGELRNEVDKGYRRVMEDEPVFAFSKSFKLTGDSKGKCESREESVMFTYALVQDPVVQFASARGLTLMKPLWQSYFSSADELVSYHYDDFETAAKLAGEYSDTLAKDAYESGSSDYQDIAALSARQVLGATQFSGTPDDPILFLKEISSNGNFQTVDVIFPAFPFFLYTNPRWLAYLLAPLLEHQLSGQYPNDYSMHDLGAHFPNATGHPDGRDEYMPVEECGNMLIMGLALANALRYDTDPAFVREKACGGARAIPAAKTWWQTVDGYGIDLPQGAKLSSTPKAAEKWLSRFYKLWKQWTGYLVRESLIPHNQLCTDDFAGWLANQTNLALKGIIGIKAMSEIADIVGEKDDAKFYRKTAGEYIEKWQEYGISRDGTHAKLAYTWYGSWTTIYNLYADSLLCFHVDGKNESSGYDSKTYAGRKSGMQPRVESQLPLGQHQGQTYEAGKDGDVFIPDRVYQMQSDWYHAVLQKYGLPLDSRHLYTKSDWEFFAAAVTGRKTRTEILTSVAKWVNETETDRPFTDLYDTEGNGGFPGIWFMARPVVGGHFAFLALERACGGKAVKALEFLDKKEPKEVDVELALMMDASTAEQYDDEGWEDL
ncbi:putative glutaminase [Triangularia verruculosa]|uniref:Glutaminase n=1 Tax=Triangularia verruculosa TaxID=2587418 RepID=A0AAN6XRC0_9PEZI|nr:putative glutaminase [Triangularia verruculosa]